MRLTARVKILGAIAFAAAMAFPAGPALARPVSSPYPALHCTGGNIPSGTYSNIVVTGECTVPAGAHVRVIGNITVGQRATLDAQSAPSTITVGGNVIGLPGAFVGLGCQPPEMVGNSAHPCTEPYQSEHSTIRVQGTVGVTDPRVVMLNGITVNGSIWVAGGGSAIPWSIKNNTVRQDITVVGSTTEWLGVMFNRVGGNVTLVRIRITDEHPGAPGLYVVQNMIRRNLYCNGITPGVSPGFVPGAVNIVGGRAFGQCKAVV